MKPRGIEQTLAALRHLAGVEEVIVVNGQSRNDADLSRAAPGMAAHSARPRAGGAQMHAGAQAAVGDVLWFLHADTLPPPDAAARIAEALADPVIVGGNFKIRFTGDFVAARFPHPAVPPPGRCSLQLGDSAYFVRREASAAVGGFRPHPIFEDLDLMRRLRRRGRFVRVPATVVTSSRRFEGRSFAVVFAWWAVLQTLYWIGVPPAWLGRIYRHVRVRGHGRAEARMRQPGRSSAMRRSALDRRANCRDGSSPARRWGRSPHWYG